MIGSEPRPHATLGADGVISFVDANHFLEELAGNIGRGRAFVQSGQGLTVHDQITVALQAPGHPDRIVLEATVVFANPPFFGLEFTNFEANLDALDTMGRDIELRASNAMGAATIDFQEEEFDEVTRRLEVPYGLMQELSRSNAEAQPTTRTFASDTQPGEILLDTNTIASSPAQEAEEPDDNTSVSALPADFFAIADPPPTPNAPSEGVERLDEIPLPRATESGVLHLATEGQLLGLWLCGLKDGVLNLFGGPSGRPSEIVSLKLVCGAQIVPLEAEIIARVGPWLTLRTHQIDPIRDLLINASTSWQNDLKAFEKPIPTSSSSEPLIPPPPLLEEANTAMPDEAMHVVRVPEASTSDAPLSPLLREDQVIFRHAGDLRHELDTNLTSGGLFVRSAPFPIRTRKKLTIVVGQLTLPPIIEADVVFADDGKVGFSVNQAPTLCQELKTILAEGFITSDEPELEEKVRGPIVEPPTNQMLVGSWTDRTEDLVTMDEMSTLRLFDHLVEARYRGVLRLKSTNGDQTIFFHDGNVAFLEALPFQEPTSLGKILTQNKRLSESALRDGLQKSKQSQHPLGQALINLGLAKSTDVVSALREQTRTRLEHAFEWRDGEYALAPWQNPPGDGELVVTRGIGILTHYLRQRFESLSQGSLESLLTPYFDIVLKPTSRLEEAALPSGLQPKELRFLQVSMDGRRTLNSAIRVSPLTKLASLRATAMGLALGLIQSDEPMVTPTAQARGHSSAAGEHMRRELDARLQQLLTQNHFEVLGVHWSSHQRGFAAAYEQATIDLKVSQPPYRDASPEIQALVRRCAQRVREAYEVLRDTDKRIAYRRQLFDQTEREYAAHMLIEKGEVELLRGDRTTAIEHLETALELDSTERNRRLLNSARKGRPL